MLRLQCESMTRPATLADINVMIEIIRHTVRTTYVNPATKERILSKAEENQFCEAAKANYLQNLNDDDHLTFVALCNEQVIGFARIHNHKQSTYLDKLYVLPQYHKNFYGLRLMINCLKNSMAIFQHNRMTLEVWEGNISAIEFYKRNLFVETGEVAIRQFKNINYSSPVMACVDCQSAYAKALRFLSTESRLVWDEYTHLDKKGADARPELTTQQAADDIIVANLPRIAVDLGAGKGRDTKYLLSKGFKVLAVESNALACESLKAIPCENLTVQCANFDEMRLDDLAQPASLINASFSLPYAGRDKVEGIVAKIAAKLIPGGSFSGQFFGSKCSFVADSKGKVASHSEQDVIRLFHSHHMDVVSCQVEAGTGKRMDDSSCEKEYLHVIAKKLM